MKFDWLIVGAGITGATFAERIASQRGESVLIVDQRDHIAGNAWDEYNEHGILEHKYGPHIFHTNSKEVWDYLSQFTEWRPYFHKVLASIDGGVTYNPQIVESPASTGIVTCATSVLTFTGTQNASFNLYPIKADFIKIQVAGVGGTPSGTVTIQGVSSWV